MLSPAKRIYIFVLSALAALSLIACGNKESSLPDNKKQDTNSKKETEYSSAESKKKRDSEKDEETEKDEKEDYPEGYLLFAETYTGQRNEKSKTEYYYNADGTIAQKRIYEGLLDEEKKKTDWQETERYEYSYWGESSSQYCYKLEDGSFILDKTRDYQYDDSGNVISEYYNYGYNVTGQDGTMYHYTYSYNEDGTLALKLAERFMNGEWQEYRINEYFYEDGKRILEQQTPGYGNVVGDFFKKEYIYNDDGELEEFISSYRSRKETDGDYTVDERELYAYDENGNRTEKEKIEVEDGREHIEYRSESEYDQAGHLLKTVRYSGNRPIATYQYEYMSPEECNRIFLKTFYGMNDSVHLTEEASDAYRGVIADYEEMYGVCREDKEEWIGFNGLYGVNYLNLLDFDGDGQEELVIAYMDRDDSNSVEGVDVWGMQGGEAVKLHEGSLCYGGDPGAVSVGILYENGIYYLCGIVHEGAFSAEYYAMEGGKFVCNHTAADDYRGILIDEQPVSSEEFKTEYDREKRIWMYPLYSKDLSAQWLMINKVKSLIEKARD